MKKVLLSFLLVIAATLAFTSCGGSKGASTAREAVEKLTDALKNGDIDAAMAVSCKTDGVLPSDEDIKKAKEHADEIKEEYAGMEVEILKEDVLEEGKKVHFNTLLKKNGKEKHEGITAYNIDGKWFADM